MLDDNNGQLKDSNKNDIKDLIKALKKELADAKTSVAVQSIISRLNDLSIDDPSLTEEIKNLKDKAFLKDNNLRQEEIQKQIEETHTEIDNLKGVGLTLKDEYPSFEKLSNKYYEEKEEELKKIQSLRNNIEDNLKNNKPIPQHELDAQIASPDNINKERAKRRKMRNYHEKVTDHYNNLTDKIEELEKNLKNKKLTQEQRTEITEQLSKVKTEYNEHTKIKEKTDAQMKKSDALLNKIVEERQKLEDTTNNLPENHPEKSKLEKLMKLKKEEHIAITTDSELPESLERNEALKRAEAKNIGDGMKNFLSKDTVEKYKSNKIAPPASTLNKKTNSEDHGIG